MLLPEEKFERGEVMDRAELASKEELRALEIRMAAEIKKNKAQLQADISQHRIDTSRDLRGLEKCMIINLLGMLSVCVTAVAVLLRMIN